MDAQGHGTGNADQEKNQQDNSNCDGYRIREAILGQKTHPKGFRLGYIQTWDSRWFADKKTYSNLLHEDLKIRDYVKKKLYHASISSIEIERSTNKCRVNVYTSKPAIVIGKRGQEVDVLRHELQRFTEAEVFINIHEVRPAEAEAQLIAEFETYLPEIPPWKT